MKDSIIFSCQKLLIGGLFLLVSNTYGQEKPTTNQVIEEVVITTDAQDLEGKVWDMGLYYYCKFTRDDERKAVIDGYIRLTPNRIEEIRRRASREHNVAEKDVTIISGSDRKEYGAYDVCVGGTKYSYIRKGTVYTYYKKVK